MINEKININIFDKWVLKNKDEGMEKGHASSVNSMVEIISIVSHLLNQKNVEF